MGTNQSQHFPNLCDKLKTHCLILDFNNAVALTKLRGALKTAPKSEATNAAKFVALWKQLAYSKQSGIPVDLHATRFTSLAKETKLEVDKLVCRYERPASQHTAGSAGSPKSSCYSCGDPGHYAWPCPSRRSSDYPSSKRLKVEKTMLMQA